MPSLRHYSALVTGSAGVLAALLFSKRENLTLSASSTEHEQHHQQSKHEYERAKASYDYQGYTQQKWDYNWDKMAPPKSTEEGKEVASSKASRTLILIRHGQYVWDPDNPDKRILTELGRKQAAITGQRLKDLGYTYDMLHFSTMPRATETAQIIMKSLTVNGVGVASRSCDLAREGAPIRPEPMHKKWRPESYVSLVVLAGVSKFTCLFLNLRSFLETAHG